MKHRITIAILTVCCIVSACASDEPGHTIEEKEKWIEKGVIACSEAQLEIGNEYWDILTGLPKDPDFDRVNVQFRNNISYFLVHIGFDKIYPGVPSASCHISIASGKVLWAGYSTGEMMVSERHFEKYELVNNIHELELGPIESREYSIRQIANVK